jgi:F-box-like
MSKRARDDDDLLYPVPSQGALTDLNTQLYNRLLLSFRPTHPCIHQIPDKPYILTLPNELLDQICGHAFGCDKLKFRACHAQRYPSDCIDKKTCLSIIHTCKKFYAVALPFLYKSLHFSIVDKVEYHEGDRLSTLDQRCCTPITSMDPLRRSFIRNSALANSCQTFTLDLDGIRCDHEMVASVFEIPHSFVVDSALRLMARMKNVTNLILFYDDEKYEELDLLPFASLEMTTVTSLTLGKVSMEHACKQVRLPNLKKLVIHHLREDLDSVDNFSCPEVRSVVVRVESRIHEIHRN